MDPAQLDRDGGYYCRHVRAMTVESLHHKAAIAAQLGARDREIDRLNKSIGILAEQRVEESEA